MTAKNHHPLLPCAIAMLLLAAMGGSASAQLVSRTAEGFDFPVAPPHGQGYYKSRGFRAGSHLGEDWLVTDGSSARSLGRPVHSIGNGVVVLARDIHAAWGNVVVIRHAWIERRQLRFVDSLYAHLDRIGAREGQQIRRGQQIGTIGNNHGMYPAHLHFEIHKDLTIGVNHSGGPRDLTSYWIPTEFIMTRRHLDGGGRNVPTPSANFILPTPSHPWTTRRPFVRGKVKQKGSHHSPTPPSSKSKSKAPSPGTYKVNRYSHG